MSEEKIIVNDEKEIPSASITFTEISVGDQAKANPNDVQFDVKYPKDYPSDKRHMPEGFTIVSKETADHFTKLGIGKVVAKK